MRRKECGGESPGWLGSRRALKATLIRAGAPLTLKEEVYEKVDHIEVYAQWILHILHILQHWIH